MNKCAFGITILLLRSIEMREGWDDRAIEPHFVAFIDEDDRRHEGAVGTPGSSCWGAAT
jgi:hypothetical protein